MLNRFRENIKIYKTVLIKDDDGLEFNEKVLVKSTKAEVKPLRGREYGDILTNIKVFYIRYCKDIDTDCVVHYMNKEYHIEDVEIIDRRYLEIKGVLISGSTNTRVE